MTRMPSHLAQPGPLGAYSDAARRMASEINLHAVVGGNAGKWCAVRLSDGGVDHTVYDTWCDAVAFQLHPHQCLYYLLPAVAVDDMLTDQAAEVLLVHHRRLYAINGGRQPHPPFPCNGRCGR
ncbi:MAG: hypothetical protein A2Y78_10105 [Acidobacteria bacterium RBG_13_68_16]|nr:MAG: hypothetical protein A2Y78_10105 [Acidobacteria bacterium RBG_13_68_16]